MADSSWREINRVFEAAVEVPEPSRRAWVAEECAGSPELEQAVVRLLESDHHAGRFLSPTFDRGLRHQGSGMDESGRRVGSYRLIEAIAHGGMGTVYLAERDDHYRRRVALKLVRQGLLREELYRRFQRERQILASLEHPYIARLYEGGRTEDGRPYLVMEYVEGRPIDRYCSEMGLAVEERLRLFRKICSAVHYAHRNLLVHRDLKPANILVTEGGAPKLLDFGIAKTLRPDPVQQELTREGGARPMTPAYASPEQVRGENVSTASDVFSLGVLLHELLTGHKPYRLPSEGLHPLERAICEQIPLRPSQTVLEARSGLGGLGFRELSRRLRGDLDTVILTALRKEPERRYPSAQQLGDDLGLHLRNQLISARADTVGYRLSRFLRRNRLTVTITAMALAALLSMAAYVTVTSLRQARWTVLEKQKSEQVLVAFLEMFHEVDPSQTGHAAPTTVEFLERGARLVTERFGDSPEIQAELLEAIGKIYTGFGYLREAEAVLQRALELRREHLGPRHPDTVENLLHLGEVFREAARLPEAVAVYEQALEIYLGQGASALRVSRVYRGLAEVALVQGELLRAEVLQRRLLSMLRESLGSRDLETSKAMNLLGNTLRIRNRLIEAEELHRRALEIETTLLAEGHLSLAGTRELLALALIAAGRYSEAEVHLRSCLESRRAVLEPGHPELARTAGNLATSLRHEGFEEEAGSLYREALSDLRERLGPEHPEVGITLHNLGMLRLRTRDLRAAEENFRAALDILRSAYGEDHFQTAETLGGLAVVLQLDRRTTEAEALYRTALTILERREERGNLAYSTLRLQFGRLLMQTGRLDEALPEIRLALKLRQETADETHWLVAEAQGTLGVCLARLGRTEQARAQLRRARPRILRHFGDNDWRVRSIDTTLAGLRREPELP